ncbi:MAG: FAD-binding protein, partial [Anaerotignaceae bacterium]
MKLIEILKKINNENNVLINEPMSKHCTFKTGGNAEIFVEAHNETALIETIKVVKENNTPFVVIGKGSNLLISDKGIKGVVIHIGKYFENITCEGETLEIAAGAPLSLVANIAMENSLTGFEFGAGIPASFGGAVFMNAGAYGGEIKNVLTEVRVLTTTFETKTS